MEETYYFNHLFQMNRKTTTDKLLNMNNEIDRLISSIKSKGLSPMEEIMCVYDYVKQFEFTKSDTSLDRRQVDGVLADKKAVCAGFSDTFNEILSRMGYKTAILESYIGETSHMHSIVEVKDSKYDINGIYNFDATFDSYDKDSYAYFGRSMEQISELYNKRVPRGCSVALMEGNTDINAIEQELPLRTMNIINGFFPSQENSEYLNKIYQEGNNKDNWKKLNEPYSFQLFNLGFKFRRAENIPMDTIEQVIENVRKKDNLSVEEIDAQMKRIKEITNKKFKEDFNDPRLIFKTFSDDYVNEEKYSDYIDRIQEIVNSKNDNDEIISTFKFLNGQERKVIHSIVKVNGEDIETLLQGEFTQDYDFGKNFLLPELNNYVEMCQLPVGLIGKPEYMNFNIRDYMMTSANGLSLSIEAGDLDFIKSVDTKVKDKNFTQQKSQQIQIPYTMIDQDDFSKMSKDDLVDMKNYTIEKKIENYELHREALLNAYNTKEDEQYIYTSFGIDADDNSVCHYKSELVDNELRQLISECDFNVDETFQTEMLEQTIIDFAKTNPKADEQRIPLSNGNEQYRVLSENNTMLELKNFGVDYINYVQQTINRIDPEEYSRSLEEMMSEKLDEYKNYSKSRRFNGYTNILLLTSLVGFAAGLITFLIISYINMMIR